MSDDEPIVKDAHEQRPVGGAWRTTLSKIVEALVQEDYSLSRYEVDAVHVP
ncbi:MAG TPA: hypothetical protein VIW29_22075 [Polyangiaceae bacterium]